MTFPDSSKKAPNVFFQVNDSTGSGGSTSTSPASFSNIRVVNVLPVLVPPVADFSALPLTGNAPLEVNFTDLTLNSPTQWQWDFDNNGIVDSVLQNPTWIYNDPGVYGVKLTAFNSDGSDSETKISYIEVVSAPAGCNLVSSQEDANVYELWHFDEGTGAIETTAAVWVYDDDTSRTLMFGDPALWSLQDGCCDTALFLGNNSTLTEHTLSPNAGGGFIGPTLSLPDGYTIEFSLYNNGNTNPSPYDYIEVFRHDVISYGGGEGIVTIRGFKGNQDLYIVYGGDIEFGTLVTIPLAVDTCTAICIEGDAGGSLSIYANGVRVLNIPMNNNDFWSTYGDIENTGGFVVYSNVTPYASELIIDEYRRSNIVRYNSATYNYQL